MREVVSQEVQRFCVEDARKATECQDLLETSHYLVVSAHHTGLLLLSPVDLVLVEMASMAYLTANAIVLVNSQSPLALQQ